MKNIYEDGAGQPGGEDVTKSGGFFEEDASVFQKPAQWPKSVAKPDKEKQHNPPDEKNSSGVLQLTPEQLSAIVTQLIASQQNAPQQNASSQNVPPPKSSEPEQTDTVNPGKRIIFQSEDFDEEPQKRKLPPIGSLEPKSRSDKNSFYDDDEIFDDESLDTDALKNVSGTRRVIYKSDSDNRFKVSEVELADDDLPDLKAQRIISTKPPKPIISSGTKPQTPPGSVFPKAVPKGSAQFEDFEEVSLEKSMAEEREIEKEPQKKKLSTGEIIRRVVLCISLIAIVVASAVLVREYYLHKQNEELESEISDMILSEAETTKKQKKESTTKKKEEATTKQQTTAPTPEQQWADIKQQYPNTLFPPNMQLKYAKLYAINNDFVGYLSADGVNLNLPIVQTDNDDEYLTKNFYGKTTKYGCPFVTHLNNITELDKNTVIFGHHMNDGTVFGALDAYKSIEGFKKAPVITFNTLYKDYKWKVIAAFITNAYEKDDNNYVFQYYFTSLSTQESFSAFLNELAQRSLYNTGVDVQASDKLLTLSTCSHEFEDARFVVVARLVRSGESEEVDVSKAVENANPRYPQAYYTKKKTDNPYVNASRWYVE
ncbi:MAG: class B sortase [Acutalibacteraceae bacterium]